MNAPDREKVTCIDCRRWLFLALGDFKVEIKCKCGTTQTIKRSASTTTVANVVRAPK